MAQNIIEVIQSDDMLQILLILVGLYFLYNYMNKKEGVQNVEGVDSFASQPAIAPMAAPVVAAPVSASEDGKAPVQTTEQKHIDSIVAGKTELKAEDLLPKYDDANAFAKENPVTKLLKEQNFLISGYHVGINTVMQSNKIPYHDIRTLPPIPKQTVGPWNQSSLEQSPGQLRRGVEIL